MLVYWLMFFVLVALALIHPRPINLDRFGRLASWGWDWLFVFFLFSTIIGFRYQVGVDWDNYLNLLDSSLGESFWQILREGDPGYGLLNWIGANLWGGIYFPNFISGLLFTWGLAVFSRSQPDPWLAMVVALPYLVVVVAMGYNRQAIAIGLAMAAIVFVLDGKQLRFYTLITLAALFHKSAVLLVPLTLLSAERRNWWKMIGALFIGPLLYKVLLDEHVDRLVHIYIVSEYESSGAFIRVLMNALPAGFFILFRHRFKLPERENRFWVIISVISLLFLVVLQVSPSSTAVDRVALYLIPIQLVVWPRLPLLVSKGARGNLLLKSLIIGYSGLVLFVWLFYSNYSFFWVPYRFVS